MSDDKIAKIELTDDAVSKLRAKHRQLKQFAVERGGQVFVVRGPDPDEFQRAMDHISDGKRADAYNELGEACLVFPDRETCRAIASEMPGIYFTAGNKVMELAGVSDGFNVKKL